MWKTLVLTLFLFKNLNALEMKSQLQQLKEQFPYAILTYDYGILNSTDLKINQCIASPSQFSESNFTAYPYWQCFELKFVKMFCNGNKFSKEEKSRMTMLVLSSSAKKEINDYISRRPMRLSNCHLFLRDWKNLIKNESHICISGEFVDSEIEKSNLKRRTWIFDRYKTKKGCDSYFYGTCELNKKFRDHCVVE